MRAAGQTAVLLAHCCTSARRRVSVQERAVRGEEDGARYETTSTQTPRAGRTYELHLVPRYSHPTSEQEEALH